MASLAECYFVEPSMISYTVDHSRTKESGRPPAYYILFEYALQP